MRGLRPALALACTLLAGTLAVPSPAAEPDGEVTRAYVIPTRHGKLYAEIVHPTTGGRIMRAPAVLTYSPYSVLGRNGGNGTWVTRGIARAWVDVLGTGNSGGCYDYGGKREKETGYDAVEWIAKQPWSTGRIGMMGGSYDGTTAIGTATLRPPHLTTIIPEAAISRWYEYAYSGGMRYVVNNEKLGRQGPTNGVVIDEQGFDTPLAFDFGFGSLPPADVTDPTWAERVTSAMRPCDEVAHVLGAYDVDSPDYTAFWLERDYVKDAGRITIPVLVSHNWGDWNVKQEEAVNLWRALTRSKNRRLYMGTRWHNHGVPGGEYEDVTVEWMEHYLKGAKNGIDRRLPAVVSQTSDSKGPLDFVAGPVPKVSQLTLWGNERFALLPARPRKTGVTSAPIPITGQNTESRAAAHPKPGVAGDFVYLETPPLTRDLRIFGEPRIRLVTQSGREWLTLTPSVLDIDPETRNDNGSAAEHEAAVAVTRGWLDTRYAKTLTKQNRHPAGKPAGVTVVAKPQDYIFRSGHRIGLIVQTDMLEWVLPKAYDAACSRPDCGTYVLDLTATSLTLPVVGPVNPAKTFAS